MIYINPYSFSSAPAPDPAAVLNYLGGVSTTSSATTQTFANVPFGAAAAGRRIFLCVHFGFSVSRTLVSATIGGVAATIHMQRSVGSAGLYYAAAIISAEVPNGTTGTVVCVFSGSTYGRIMSYRAANLLSAVPSATVNTAQSGTEWSSSITIPADGFVIACVTARTAGSFTVTGITERYDAEALISNFRIVGASLTTESLLTSRPFSFNVNDGYSAGGPLLAAAFR